MLIPTNAHEIFKKQLQFKFHTLLFTFLAPLLFFQFNSFFLYTASFYQSFSLDTGLYSIHEFTNDFIVIIFFFWVAGLSFHFASRKMDNFMSLLVTTRKINHQSNVIALILFILIGSFCTWLFLVAAPVQTFFREADVVIISSTIFESPLLYLQLFVRLFCYALLIGSSIYFVLTIQMTWKWFLPFAIGLLSGLFYIFNNLMIDPFTQFQWLILDFHSLFLQVLKAGIVALICFSSSQWIRAHWEVRL